MSDQKSKQTFKYPGKRMALDGNTAVIMCERESSDAAGAYPITPSTQMGEYWAEEAAKGHLNVSGRPLIFVEPEGEHAAAGVTAGMSMTGLRASNFSSAQGIAYMHESLYAAVGKRLPYVLNMGCRAMTKSSLNVHCGHDDYHCVDDTGMVQIMAKNAQEAADLNLVARRVAELSLTPAVIAQDGFLTTHLIEPLNVPERELIEEYLGRPDDIIECPTPAQKILYGDTRRRVPELWDVDNPVLTGPVENQDAYMQSVVAQRPYFFDHVREFTEQAMEEFYQLTGRRYECVSGYRTDDADYIILGQGSMIVQAEAVADYLREKRKLKVGVVNMTLFRPFPGDLLGPLLKGKKGVAVLERVDQPLAEDLPLIRELRASLIKCVENASFKNGTRPFPDYDSYSKAGDMPRLYSACYGLGSRDLQPEALVAAVENMLPDGEHRPFYYLSVDFVHESAANPKQEIHQQRLIDAYPRIEDLALRGSENPDLRPANSTTVRIHSVGGWGAITTGKNLAMTLFNLLDLDIKANPKYGSEKKGQPTTYYLSAAPEPIRLNCEYHYVDVVMSPDPNVFSHSNPLAGLTKGGAFIIQSELGNAEAVWNTFPRAAKQYVIDNDIRVFYLDGFRIAREEASNPDLQFRMQGNAFQGAFFAASPLMQRTGLDEAGLFAAIDNQLRHKFGSKGERIVQDNLRVVRRGFDEIHEITDKPLQNSEATETLSSPGLPLMLQQLPEGDGGIADVHRFWEQTGSFYASGQANENLADPYVALSLMPASSGVFRDMTNIRFDYPEFIPENCTGCGNCFSVCPDSAIPGLVNDIGEVFNSAITRIETGGQPTRYLRREVRQLESNLRALIDQAGEKAPVNKLIHKVISDRTEQFDDANERQLVDQEFQQLLEVIGDFKFAITKPYYLNREKKTQGSGGLFSVTINPYTCKGCMECVEVCDDEALLPKPQTRAAIDKLRHDWSFWTSLPTTKPDYIRVTDLDEKIGALETLLLDKHNLWSMSGGDGACVGCGEKTIIRLFTSTVTALMQPRVAAQIHKLDQLIKQLDERVHLKLASSISLDDESAVRKLVAEHRNGDLKLADLSASLGNANADPIDSEWLERTTHLLNSLRHLKWQYEQGTTGRGRAEMGIVNATGCSSVWGSTYPYNPYPFPWANHLFQDSPSMALGAFQGHMAKMAEGFKAIRMAELELGEGYSRQEHDEFFAYFDWQQFSDEEWRLCPPVVAIGGDGAMYDIGFQNLSRALISNFPVKVMVLDTQVYSNTGGQACTSGYTGQVSDMAQFGKVWKGKPEIRKEIALVGMAHRNAYILQGSMANTTHLLEGFIDGLNSRRPALFNCYAPCQPEHGIGDDASMAQSKMAVESRAYPLFRYDPDAGVTFAECMTLEGNPSMREDWPSYALKYQDASGIEQHMDLPLTFADFALTEGRFRKHFKQAPHGSWNEKMVPLHEFIELAADERDDRYPYIWSVNAKNQLSRVMVSETLVRTTEDRRDFWQQLKSMAGEGLTVAGADSRDNIRQQIAQEMTSRLMSLILDREGGAELDFASVDTSAAAADTAANSVPAAASNGYEPVWIDTPECDGCEECILINSDIFAFNGEKKAEVVNAKGGPYKDIVKAAEKCSSACIHPGTPWNPDEPGVDKLITRAQPFQ